MHRHAERLDGGLDECAGSSVERSKQTNVLGIVLALGAAAVCIDQFVLGGGMTTPETAAASPTPAEETPIGVSQPERRGQTLAAKLAAYHTREVGPAQPLESSAFEAPASWFKTSQVANEPVRSEKIAAVVDEKPHGLQLTSIMMARDRNGQSAPLAVISGHSLTVGQSVTMPEAAENKGETKPSTKASRVLTLLSVSDGKVTVDLNGTVHELVLARSSLTERANATQPVPK